MFALIVAALSSAPLQAQVGQGSDEARAVIGSVLAHQVSMRGAEAAQDICVAGSLNGLPLPPDSAETPGPEHAVHIRFQWHVPEPPALVRPPRQEPEPGRRERRERRRTPPLALPAALAPEAAAELDGLRAEASRMTDSPALSAIDAAAIPAPLRLEQPDSSCWLLSLSAPAFAGDAAFVAVDLLCGSSCGNGSLYALRRRENGWEVVAVADTWID